MKFWTPLPWMALVCLTACGGGMTRTITLPPLTSYTIGGTVSGLSGTGLVLQNNGGNNLTINANGDFAFTALMASGANYNVTILTQPANPTQNCTLTNAVGTVSANVTNLQVACVNIYTIGGTVSGLTGAGLVLQNNGDDNLPVSANGGFTFTDLVASGTSYNVTVLSQPTTPTQNCNISNSSGNATANVTNLQVVCSNVIVSGWTWMGGSNLVNQSATYGSLGVSNPANIPGPREAASTWTDATGNLWLFGGFGSDSTGSVSTLNDLWKYGLGEWTWIGGSDLADQPGIYGTQGTPSPTNIPGTRKGAFAWTDRAGNFWLFGGLYPRTPAEFNDLWMYSAGEWTWVSGSNLANQPPSYGTQGTADPGNIPGARVSGASWIDPTGNLWLFGGDGYASDGFGLLNDLWKYNAGQWTWISGADIGNQLGTYGTLGTASPANVPGARRLAVSWTDASGSLWLFGGNGYAASGGAELNDLWKYSAGQWTWMGGANVPNQSGTYGTQGTPAAGNVPGARDSAVSWADGPTPLAISGSSAAKGTTPQGST
jgi:hypothetical protein